MDDHKIEPGYIDRVGVTTIGTCLFCGKPAKRRRYSIRDSG